MVIHNIHSLVHSHHSSSVDSLEQMTAVLLGVGCQCNSPCFSTSQTGQCFRSGSGSTRPAQCGTLHPPNWWCALTPNMLLQPNPCQIMAEATTRPLLIRLLSLHMILIVFFCAQPAATRSRCQTPAITRLKQPPGRHTQQPTVSCT
jgi:hypothetical protein